MGRFDSRATEIKGPGEMLRWKLFDPLRGRNKADHTPFTPPSKAYDAELTASARPSLTWIGHASFLLTLDGKKVLIDPVFAPALSGVVKRLAPPGIPLEALPAIDVVLVTHNHRDHLDAWTLRQLGAQPTYVVPLGNGAQIRALTGATTVVELDWWEHTAIGPLEVTLTPARHWSMRMPWDRNDALWGGFVIRGSEGTVYHSGDTAMFDGFAEIGSRLGPVDWALLPVGAYQPRWFMKSQHIDPNEAVSAALALKARTMVAMHWGTFRLTDEPLSEPPVRARLAWAEKHLDPERLWVLDIGESRALDRR